MKYLKSSFIITALVIHLLSCARSLAIGLKIPTSDESIADSISSELPAPYTAAELAVPPAGEIQKSYLRTVNGVRTRLTTTLAAVPAGADGQGSPWYAKAQAYKTGLDKLATSCLQADCFALIPDMANLFESKHSDAPHFANDCWGLANDFSTVLFHAMERHIINQNGTVTVANLTQFVRVFSLSGFISMGDWESTPMPIQPASIMVLDAAATVAYLKTRPWQEAAQFLGNASAANAFARYAPSGNGMAVLKTKYAGNQAIITEKWNELTAWVATQRPPN